MDGLVRWQVTFAWDGSNYLGWQRQAGGRSLQELIENAVGAALNLPAPPHVKASGRTDAGVHALAQVVSFMAPADRSPASVVASINHHLPIDVAALSANIAPPGFDPRHWARRKLYRYRLLNRETRCPFRHNHTWRWRAHLDEGRMDEAAKLLIGRHDFSAFRASRCGARHPFRTLVSAEVFRKEDEVQLEFVGNGFLRHQVRIMVGTLLEIGQHRKPPEWAAEVLNSRDRAQAGRTAPASGLWLVWVQYGDGPDRPEQGGQGDDLNEEELVNEED